MSPTNCSHLRPAEGPDGTRGAGGDVIDISDMLVGFSSGNESQFVQCLQSGGNATIRVDANGAVGGAAFSDVCVLSGQSATLGALLADGNILLS